MSTNFTKIRSRLKRARSVSFTLTDLDCELADEWKAVLLSVQVTIPLLDLNRQQNRDQLANMSIHSMDINWSFISLNVSQHIFSVIKCPVIKCFNPPSKAAVTLQRLNARFYIEVQARTMLHYLLSYF